MTRWSSRRERFREILAGDDCLHPASVYDPISARIAEDLGFETAMLAGSIASLSELGAPDIIVLTLTELSQQVLRISRAGELPLLVDADHGYGNAHNVARTVQELETAGVAALSIEDTLLPQPFGGGAPTLVSLEEGVGKMRAALAARGDSALVVAGRTSAAQISGAAEAVRRVRAYAEAGVDAIFLVGVQTRDDLDAIAAEVDLPLVVGGIPGALRDDEYLAARGARICLQGHQPFAAAVQAVYVTMKALREGVPPGELDNLASAELMQRLTRAEAYARASGAFLGAAAD